MPLSPAADRQLLHLRDIALRGYHRADGLFDIEAHLTDRKTDIPLNESGRADGHAPDRPIHDMWIRLTVDLDLVVQGCEASSDFTPYDICPRAAPNFAALVGLRIGPGFNRAVAERVGGTQGCTHLRELLGQMATTAFQTIYPWRARAERAAAEAGERPRGRPGLVGTCIAYAPDSPVTLARWPWLKEQGAGG